MAVHAEDVAGMEIRISMVGGRSEAGGQRTPASCGAALGHLLGAFHIARAAGDGVHGVVQHPCHITGAVHACVVILVPLSVGIVGMGGVLVSVLAVLIPVGETGILRLEEVDPALRDADGGSLIAGAHVLPVPSTAVDVQAGTHRLQRRGKEVLQRLRSGRTVYRRGIRLGHKGLVNTGRNTVVLEYANGIPRLQRVLLHGYKARRGADGIDCRVAVGGHGLIFHLNGVSRDCRDGSGRIAVEQRRCRDHATGHGQVIEIAFLQDILNLVIIGDGHLIFHGHAVIPEAMSKCVHGIPVKRSVVLNAEIDRL